MTVANWAKFLFFFFFFPLTFPNSQLLRFFLQRKNYFLPYGFYCYYKQNIIKWLQVSTLFESRCFLREVVKKKNAMTVIRERNLRFLTDKILLDALSNTAPCQCGSWLTPRYQLQSSAQGDKYCKSLWSLNATFLWLPPLYSWC